ncbi:transposable element Tcb2 transposase [Trichonephila clavipes]|nr:transposable element Tcb2 transposase [Trichonephila clavipes]
MTPELALFSPNYHTTPTGKITVLKPTESSDVLGRFHWKIEDIVIPKGVFHWTLEDKDLEPFFVETGSGGRRPGQGRRRATTPNEDRYLVLTARRHRNMNAILLQQLLSSATGTTVSSQTVRNRLHGVGLYARRPMV